MTVIQEPKIRLRDGVLYAIQTELGISRDGLARQLGISSASAYKIDVGRVGPSTDFMARLIQFTGKDFDELFEVVEGAAA